jgi:hypothetical protein
MTSALRVDVVDALGRLRDHRPRRAQGGVRLRTPKRPTAPGPRESPGQAPFSEVGGERGIRTREEPQSLQRFSRGLRPEWRQCLSPGRQYLPRLNHRRSSCVYPATAIHRPRRAWHALVAGVGDGRTDRHMTSRLCRSTGSAGRRSFHTTRFRTDHGRTRSAGPAPHGPARWSFALFLGSLLSDRSSPFRRLSFSAWTGELLGDSLDRLTELLDFLDLLVEGLGREAPVLLQSWPLTNA